MSELPEEVQPEVVEVVEAEVTGEAAALPIEPVEMSEASAAEPLDEPSDVEPVEGSEVVVGADELVEPAEVAAEAAEAEVVAESEPIVFEPDEVLLASRDVARQALAEITEAQTIGAEDGHEVHEQHVLTLYFECRLPGYPGWRWAATLSRVDEESPVNVLEVELLPGAGAVTAPEWVPWSVRLAQYREAQARQAVEEAAEAEAAAAELTEEDDVEPDEDLLENDFSDFDDEIDGVDLDEDDDSEESDDDDEADDLSDDADADDDDDTDEDDADEDGFTEMDEHDLHDHSHDEVDFEHDDEEE
ncbi:MAG: DUF3027 domain-containing protein [Actinobacteria bacterium]|jgi:hypothetical protein|nr:DUF3027 domain-containing protein [Actinomycetota bacterium]